MTKETRRRLLTMAILLSLSVPAEQVSAVDVGREVHSNDIVLANTNDFTSDKPSAVGLKIFGNNARITQRGNILLTGDMAVAIQIDGSASKVTIRRGTQIYSEGLHGKGILILGGKGHNLIINGDIVAAGNAFEISEGVRVKNLSLTGLLAGGGRAIYISRDSSVESIDIDKWASLSGDIISYGDTATNLNFNTNINYNGNISGIENINLRVKEGTLNFGGAADVLSVEVGEEAKLFGGTFHVNDFINHGTIGAGSADTNLIIDGNLTSNGTLKRISGGKAGWIGGLDYRKGHGKC